MGRDILQDDVIGNFHEFTCMLKIMSEVFLMVLVVAFFLRTVSLVTVLLVSQTRRFTFTQKKRMVKGIKKIEVVMG